jgi:hypothetical protein
VTDKGQPIRPLAEVRQASSKWRGKRCLSIHKTASTSAAPSSSSGTCYAGDLLAGVLVVTQEFTREMVRT